MFNSVMQSLALLLPLRSKQGVANGKFQTREIARLAICVNPRLFEMQDQNWDSDTALLKNLDSKTPKATQKETVRPVKFYYYYYARPFAIS